jgi:neutral ceramidase
MMFLFAALDLGSRVWPRFVLLALLLQSTIFVSAKEFRAGAAASNITPRLGVPLSGALYERKAQRIHDELYARCLVLDDGATRLAIVVVDSTLISRESYDAAKRIVHEHTGLSMDHMLMSATHTHSAPAAVSQTQIEPDEEYVKFLTVKMADCVDGAVKNLVPAKVGWGIGKVPEYVFSRRWKMRSGAIPPNPFGGVDQVVMHPQPLSTDLLGPAGPTDPEVAFLSLQSKEGKPIALLANYSLHYVGGVPEGEVSADYFGVFSNRIRQLLGAENLDSPFVGILSNGTSGDIFWVNPRREQLISPPYTQMQRVANLVAAEVYRVYLTIEHHDWVPIEMLETEIQLGVRFPSPGETAHAERIMADATYPVVASPLDRNKALEQFYARETVLLSKYPKTVRRPLQALRIGDLAILGIPNEVFAETGLELKQKSPFKPTFTISLAGGYSYLPPAQQHKLGGFETWRARHSFLEIDAAEKIVDRLLELLAKLRAR